MSPAISAMLEDLIYFHNQFSSKSGYVLPQKSDVQYPVDVKYNKDRIIFEYYVAGIEKEDLKVEVEEDHLIVTHEYHKEDLSPEEFSEHIKEMCSYTSILNGVTKKEFRHVWKVNPVFDMTQIQVVHYNGVLSIVIPRIPEKKKEIKSIKF